jgi:DNA-binding transcriptional MerR regulator
MKIGELSQTIGLSTYTIRYYEKLGLLNEPSKDKNGHRFYNHKDVDLANWVTCLKKAGMSLEKIKVYTNAYKKNEYSEVSKLLKLHLVKLITQQKDIKHYIDVTEKKLKELKNRLT